MATTPTKTVQSIPVAWQDLNSGAQVITSTLNCNTIWGAAFGIRLGRQTGSAFTAGAGPNIRIEATTLDTPDSSSWIPLYSFTPSVGSSIANTTLNGAVSAGASNFVVASASNIAAGDILFLGDNSAANYELVRVKSVASTTITPERTVVNAHVTGAIVTDQAEMVFPAVDLKTYKQLQIVGDNAGSGQKISVQVTMLTFDSYA